MCQLAQNHRFPISFQPRQNQPDDAPQHSQRPQRCRRRTTSQNIPRGISNSIRVRTTTNSLTTTIVPNVHTNNQTQRLLDHSTRTTPRHCPAYAHAHYVTALHTSPRHCLHTPPSLTVPSHAHNTNDPLTQIGKRYSQLSTN